MKLEACLVEAADVDMQPEAAGSPEARRWTPWPSGTSCDWGMAEEAQGPSDSGRHVRSWAQLPRGPRLVGDKGPRRLLSKRKLELLLAEPVKRKRLRQSGA